MTGRAYISKSAPICKIELLCIRHSNLGLYLNMLYSGECPFESQTSKVTLHTNRNSQKLNQNSSGISVVFLL